MKYFLNILVGAALLSGCGKKIEEPTDPENLAAALKDTRLCFEIDKGGGKMVMYAQFGSDGTVRMGPYKEGEAFEANKGTYKVDGLIVKISMDGKDEGSFTFSKEGLALGDTFEMKDVGKVTISRIEKAGELKKME